MTGIDYYIEKLKLTNFLSYEDIEVKLGSLNILIGVNGSGKSNFLQAFNLLHALPNNFWSFFNSNGRTEDWIYNGDGGDCNVTVEATFNRNASNSPFRHNIEFGVSNSRTEIYNEIIEWIPDEPTDRVTTLYDYKYGSPVIYSERLGKLETILREDVSPQSSILTQRKDPQNYTMLAVVSSLYNGYVHLDTQFGLSENLRRPQRADAQNENALDPDARNLSIILNHLDTFNPETFSKIENTLKRILPRTRAIKIVSSVGMITALLREEIAGTPRQIPIQRISDGTLRFLCLLVILLAPNPPPLICIEEPEIGMHPEMLLVIAELLKEASQRTQIIVTTHSDILLSAFTDTPEAILVCEHDGAKSSITRLDADSLSHWLEEYTLGDLWLRNVFGGMRNDPPVEV
ncbi:MAG: AAA family ATPase [Armatimonadetes bacterium]|nr:AAA family ATPase [Armatimonadota bacterium]